MCGLDRLQVVRLAVKGMVDLFDFFVSVLDFFQTLLVALGNFFSGLLGLVKILIAVPSFFANLHFLPPVLLSAVMLTVNIALVYVLVGRNIGG